MKFARKYYFIVFTNILFLFSSCIKNNGEIYENETEFNAILINEKLTITGYKGNSIDITIPDKINNIPVISIGSNIFGIEMIGHKYINSIIFPNSIKTIKSNEINISKITIGSDVFIDEQMKKGKNRSPRTSFERFRRTYNANGKLAGTYIYDPALPDFLFGFGWKKE